MPGMKVFCKFAYFLWGISEDLGPHVARLERSADQGSGTMDLPTIHPAR